MPTYVIGDVHGCLDELKSLLNVINYARDTDVLWFCGDTVSYTHLTLPTIYSV